jgi:hypothetical protein
MRRRVFWAVVGAPLALIVIGAGAALSLPMTRHVISAVWNLPDRMPALPGDGQVHYEPGAEQFARDVAALLPDAVARVEAVHGRPFAHPVTIGAYATPEAYMTANAVHSMAPVGVTFFGRVNLSPRLFRPQHQRLRAILTHELSHAHIQGWIGSYAYIHLPNWFKEGLAVMVSGGGGAEFVSEDEARAAIGRGERLVIYDTGGFAQGVGVALENAPADKPDWYPTVLAYREAGMFVDYLHETDRPGFDRMMNAILDGRPFKDAVATGYHDDARSLWQKFLTEGLRRPPGSG